MNQVKTEWIDQQLRDGKTARHGLRRPASSNTCFFNSLMVALRSLVEVLRSVLSDGMIRYYSQRPFDADALHGFHALLKSMLCQRNSNDNETEKNRERMVETLIQLGEQVDVEVGNRPIERNQQGDPNELLLYLIGWFEESLQSMMDEEHVTSSSQERAVCTEAINSAKNIIQLLKNMMPLMSEKARCPCGHRLGNAEKSFVWISLDPKCNNIKQCLDKYFASEDFEANCSKCGRQRSMKKCVRLEDMPGDVFALGIRLFNNVGAQVNFLKQYYQF